MKRGAWHQCGHQGQTVADELLQIGVGVGAILSPLNLAMQNATEYSEAYRGLGAEVLLDPQFYTPKHDKGFLATYPTIEYRKSIDALGALQIDEMSGLSEALEAQARTMGVSAMIAPGVVYEASAPKIEELNAKLFHAAKVAGDGIGIPTYATVVLSSGISTSEAADAALSAATSLPADGWYYSFEFKTEEIPASPDELLRYCSSSLILACTGKPVLHAFAGPMANLAFGAGARAAGIGMQKTLWGFRRERFEEKADAGGGGGGAPPRFFATPLWGRIIFPDETRRVDAGTLAKILAHTPHSGPVTHAGNLPWGKKESQKHLVHAISDAVTPLANLKDARAAMTLVQKQLEAAQALCAEVRVQNVDLNACKPSYHGAWITAAKGTLEARKGDYDFLELVGGP